jgi:hypothetical protein
MLPEKNIKKKTDRRRNKGATRAKKKEDQGEAYPSQQLGQMP